MCIGSSRVRRAFAGAALACVLLVSPGVAHDDHPGGHSVARQWNELLLDAIRNDFARPTVHARNLFHTSVAMWDGWAAYDTAVRGYLHDEDAFAKDFESARAEAISFAAYRILRARFGNSPGAAQTLSALDAKMRDLGYNRKITTRRGNRPAAVGNRIAHTILAYGAADGANEQSDYANLFYEPVNAPLLPAFPGNPTITDVNRWQPLALDFFVDQSGNPLPSGTPDFLGPEWGEVQPFALTATDRSIYRRDGHDYWTYLDPGAPPQRGGAGDAAYRDGFAQVVEWSSLLDPADGVMIDISPGARGNNTLGTNDGTGHGQNPATGAAYPSQTVPAGDYYRVLAEFWADGPDSETPPGHWFVLANGVSDHPALEKRVGGAGPVVDALEWDVKLYVSLGGAVHDCAVAAWGVKGWYDYIRPVSAIRSMADQGQSSDPNGPSYNADGIPLIPNVIEVVTAATIQADQRHEHLAGESDGNVGKIAVRSWRGPDFIGDPATSTAGVAWILAEDWWPYQRPSFVTPPFAGYVSGHSTFSRAAAQVLTSFTGDAFFPGGLGEFAAPKNEFLVFEDGPSVDITLQWATYFDAADECSLSRIYGGIHPPADDIPGRLMGEQIGEAVYARAQSLFERGPPVRVQAARIRMRQKNPDLIVLTGLLYTRIGGPEDAFDVTSGMTVSVRDSLDVEHAGTLAAGECKVKKSGKIRGKSIGRTVDVTFTPVKNRLGTYRFKIRMKFDTLGKRVRGPLAVSIRTGDVERTGRINNCVEHGPNPGIRCD